MSRFELERCHQTARIEEATVPDAVMYFGSLTSGARSRAHMSGRANCEDSDAWKAPNVGSRPGQGERFPPYMWTPANPTYCESRRCHYETAARSISPAAGKAHYH